MWGVPKAVGVGIHAVQPEQKVKMTSSSSLNLKCAALYNEEHPVTRALFILVDGRES